MQQRFERPASIAEASRQLATGSFAVLAGGTDLYAAHVGKPIATPLLDITGIAELRGILREGTCWTIGATTTWSDVVRADLPPLFDALKAAAREVGGVQIQNTGTVAGNVCNASPAADGTPVLMALGASVVLRGERGERVLPIEQFVLGNRRTARAADELVVALRVPARGARARSAFAKLGGRRYLTIAVTTVAVVVDVDQRGCVEAAGVSVGSCSAVARRLPALEARLAGAPVSSDLAALLGAADLIPLAPIDDLRASAAYRLDATRTLLRRALLSIATAP
ncbi:MAG: FAD binding domain-containing protein [Caldimonas sp.]